MEAEELRALLEAAARELQAVSRSLPAEGTGAAAGAAAELAEARQALSEAVGLCAEAAARGEPGEDLREALALRAGAVRGCQEAERELALLQQEHSSWLQRLHVAEGLRCQGQEQLQSSAKRLDEERAAAAESCKALEIEVQQLRDDLSAKSRQLEDSSKRASALNASSRGLRKEQMRCEAQIMRASEIFALQESTERHIRDVSEQIAQLDRRLVEEWREDIARAEALQEEWAVQETLYREQESELEAMAVEVQESYEERWLVAEKERMNRVGGQALLQDRAQRSCAQKLARLDAEQQGEAVASRRLVEQQRELLAEARATATAEMEERLGAKQQELERQAGAVQQRADADRDRWLVRADYFKRQALEHKGNIAQVSAVYRSRLPPPEPPAGTPSGTPRRRPPGGSPRSWG